MKTMARKRLSGLARLSLAFIVALTLAMPYSGTNAYATGGASNTSGATELDIVAHSSNAKAYSSLDEAKAALETANQNKANAASSKNEAQKALDKANASYNQAASVHGDAVKAAQSVKAQADSAVDDTVRAVQGEYADVNQKYTTALGEYQEAEKKLREAEANLRKAESDVEKYKSEFGEAVKDINDPEVIAAAQNYNKAEEAYFKAAAEKDKLTTDRKSAEAAAKLALQKKNDAAKAEAAAKSAADSAAEAASAASQKVADIQGKINGASGTQETQRKALEAALANAKSALATAQSTLTTKNAALKTAQEAAEAANTEYLRLKAQLDNAGSSDADTELAKLQKAYEDAKADYEAKKSTYEQGTETGSYAATIQELNEAQTAYDDCVKKEQAAKDKYDEAKRAYDASLGQTGNTDTQQGDELATGTGTDSTPTEGDSTASGNGDDTGTTGDTTDPGSDENPPTLEQVNQLETEWNTAKDNLTNATTRKNTADGVYEAVVNGVSPKMIKELEDEAVAKKEAWDAAKEAAGSGGTSDLEAQVAAAKQDLDTKNQAVRDLQSEIAALDIEGKEQRVKEAQKQLDDFAPDNSALEQELEEAREAERLANEESVKAANEFSAAQNATKSLTKAAEEANQKVESARLAEQTYDTDVLTPATTAYTNETKQSGNPLDSKLEAYWRSGINDAEKQARRQKVTVAIQKRNDLKSARTVAYTASTKIEGFAGLKADVENKRVPYLAADQDRTFVENKLLGLVKSNSKSELTANDMALWTALKQDQKRWNEFTTNPQHEYYTDIDDIILNPFAIDPDSAEENAYLAELNVHANNVKAARDLVTPVQAQRDSAKAELDAAQNSFNTASSNYDRAAAEAAEIQAIVDNWKDASHSSNNKPATKPAVKKADSNGKATIRTADKKAPAKDEAVAEQTDEQTAEEAVITTTSQEQRTPAQPKAWTFFGVDPLIAGIVGGAILIAAAAAIAAAIMRHRRNTAEAAESNE